MLMLSPDNQVGTVPEERIAEAEKLGFHRAVTMTAPNGNETIVSYELADKYLAAGFKIKI
jgi:hypothetical protein